MAEEEREAGSDSGGHDSQRPSGCGLSTAKQDESAKMPYAAAGYRGVEFDEYEPAVS